MPEKYQYSDIDIDFNKNVFTSDVSRKLDKNSVQQSIVNIIMTIPGEKPFNRSFGFGMHSLLFENLGPLDEMLMKNNMKLAIHNYEPRVSVDDIFFITSEVDSNQLTVKIDYNILKGRNAPPIHDSVSIGISKVR